LQLEKVTHVKRQLRKEQGTATRTVTERVRAGGKRRLGALNRETIVAAALSEIDRNGLENFSLRGLAKSLKVFPSAVVWHVTGRTSLLADVAALALADILPPGFPDSWQGYLREFFHRYREALRRHPNVASLIGAQLVANRAVDFEFVERLLAALAHAGLAGAKLAGAYSTVMAALVGFTTQEFAPLPVDGTTAWQHEIRERLHKADGRKYPILVKNMKFLENKTFILRWQNGTEAPMDAAFEVLVDIVITGLEQLARAS
jgi:TetR/AcrR family transcriptional regulator, tetracycline repressor protein